MKFSCEVFFEFQASCKNELFQKLAFASAPRLAVDPKELYRKLLANEKHGTTGLGPYVSLPYVCHAAVKEPFLGLCKLSKPLVYDTNAPEVDIIAYSVMSMTAQTCHFRFLNRLARSLSDEALVRQMQGALSAKLFAEPLLKRLEAETKTQKAQEAA